MVDQSSLKFLGAERNFSISPDHIYQIYIIYIIYIKIKVSKENGSNLEGASKVGFENYPVASFFNQVNFILGGKLISSASNTYAHCIVLEVLLNYDNESAESQLGRGLFCKDTAGQMEENTAADPVLNTGLGTRSKWTKGSKIVELQSRIHSDLFNQENLILNGVDLTIKLHHHKPEFCLLSADTAPAYKITIVDAILYVKKIELTPSVFNAINTVLNDKMHSMPLRELLLKYLRYQEDNKVNT